MKLVINCFFLLALSFSLNAQKIPELPLDLSEFNFITPVDSVKTEVKVQIDTIIPPDIKAEYWDHTLI